MFDSTVGVVVVVDADGAVNIDVTGGVVSYVYYIAGVADIGGCITVVVVGCCEHGVDSSVVGAVVLV